MISLPIAILLGLWVVGIGVNIAKHGEPINGKYNWGATLLGRAIWVALLAWAGVFDL